MFSTFSSIFTQFYNSTTTLYRTLPSLCPICQLPQSGSLLCDCCYSILAQTEAGCFQCAEPLPLCLDLRSKVDNNLPPIRCGRCQKVPPAFDQVIAQLAYQEPLSKLIQQYKFSHQLRLIPCLTDCIIKQIEYSLENGYQLPDALVAVPLHRHRLRQRGFNQSLLLANRVSKHFQIPLLKQLVIRTKKTGEQATLKRKHRIRNIYNAFETTQNFQEDISDVNKLAIIDDVITSGSTCNELARILKKAGIIFVDIWCIAKTPFIK